MRLTDSTLDQVRVAVDAEYKYRQFGSGGESAKVTITSFLEDCKRVEDSEPDAEFRYTAEIFEPSRTSQVIISMYAKGQAQFVLATVRVDYSWTVSNRIVPEPITTLPAAEAMPSN